VGSDGGRAVRLGIRSNTGGTDRPNQVSDPTLDNPTISAWLNTAAFVAQPINTVGNTGSNTLHGPSFKRVDLSVFKNVGVSGAVRVQLRVEVFNLFNTPSFANPNAALGTAGFGSITSTGNNIPRQMPFAAKLLFWSKVSRMRTFLLAGVALAALAAVVDAQPPPGRGGGRGQVTSPRNAYPDRPAGDPAAIERGRALYGVNCAFCHGADTRGGDSGPSLLRSSVVLDDRNGELMAPIVKSGRPDRGMPKFAFSDDQIADVAAFIHTFRAAGYDESRQKPPSILVGDAKAGEALFAAKCASCHSATGDLRGIATKIADEKLLQQTWLMPGSGGGRGAGAPVVPPAPTAVVTTASGERVEGRVTHLDDFTIALVTADGGYRSFRIDGASPKIAIKDPLDAHRNLLRTYTDRDIHDVTAYLVTLK